MPILGLDAPHDGPRPCQLVGQGESYHHFAVSTHPTTSQLHIKPLHWYIACRLVIEGGFMPDEIYPHPPLTVVKKGGKNFISYDVSVANSLEDTIIGGLKSKDVDVVVGKKRIGPVIGISCKGLTKSQRNLTNRLEEAVGECTNLHITYPSLVLGFMFLMRGNRRDAVLAAELGGKEIPMYADNDVVINSGAITGNEVVDTALRFHRALCELTGREGIREQGSRYESCSLTIIESSGPGAGSIYPQFPVYDSAVNERNFFSNIYRRYDERYVLSAPSLNSITERVSWEERSPLFSNDPSNILSAIDYEARLSE